MDQEQDQSLRQRHTQHPSEPPPSYEECVGGSTPGLDADGGLPPVPSLSHDEARKSLLRSVNKKWFVNRNPAIEFEFVRVQPARAFRYELQTYMESRTAAWAHKPYHSGDPVDSPDRGEEPDLWSIRAQPQSLFTDEEKKLELAHTASVEVCHGCQAVGRIQCWKCKGGGQAACAPCEGAGMIDRQQQQHPQQQQQQQQQQPGLVERVTCNACKGAGIAKCSECSGSGEVKCEACQSAGRLKKFRELTITWQNLSADRIIELSGLPHKCIREAQARKLVDDERPQLFPLTDFPLPSINIASQELLEKHRESVLESKVLMQRQSVYFIPVYEVTGTWKTEEFSYWVYGYDHSAHCSDYPGSTCDCNNCTLL